MVKLFRIRFLKNTGLKNAGDVVNASKSSAKSAVDGGYAEYVEEPTIKKVVKKKKVKKKVKMEEKIYLSKEEVKSELYKAIELDPLDQDEFLAELCKKSGKRIGRLREQLKIYEREIKAKRKEEVKAIEEKKEEEDKNDAVVEEESVQTGKDILMTEANEEEVKSYKKGVNWVEDDYMGNSWKRLKSKTAAQLKMTDKMFQLLSKTGSITGKPQIRDNDVKTSITLLVRAIKRDKDGNESTSYKFIDDPYNRRDDGYEDDVLEDSYWVYDVVEDGIKYIVLCKRKLENHETHIFHGTSIKVNHSKEFDKNLMCRGSANIFFCYEAESSIKPMEQEKIIPYINDFLKENNVDVEKFKKMMFDYIFIHENGIIYNQPEDYMLLRHAQLLSGKEEGYPLHFFLWGGFGVGKTQEIECLDRIFGEGILEAANSTPKSLIPSFSEKIPNPGFILNCNRVALIDEMMKMVDNALNNTRNSNDVKNQLSNLNFILEHRSRKANSGNGNLYCKPTSKVIVTTNPSLKSKYIYEELNTMDPSTFSRCLCYVKGEEHVKFIESNKLENCANTYPLWCMKNSGETKNISHNLRVFAQLLRSFYVTIYDSCQHFLIKWDEGRVENIFRSSVALAKNEMRTVWKRRGMHHTKLVLDGIVKYRCIFKDFDSSFEAIDEDYDNLERVLFGMIKNWDFDMTIGGDDLWKTL